MPYYVFRISPEKQFTPAGSFEKYPEAKIPLALKIKGPLTLSAGINGKLRALRSAVVHPGRLKYRYWPWRRPEA